MGYSADDSPARGLLWVSTSRLTQGYFGDSALTSAAFKDLDGDGRRWFNTGEHKLLEFARFYDV